MALFILFPAFPNFSRLTGLRKASDRPSPKYSWILNRENGPCQDCNRFHCIHLKAGRALSEKGGEKKPASLGPDSAFEFQTPPSALASPSDHLIGEPMGQPRPKPKRGRKSSDRDEKNILFYLTKFFIITKLAHHISYSNA